MESPRDSWVLANADGLDRSTGLPATPAWTRLPDGPEPRYFHAAAYDAVSNRMVVFGGLGNSGYRNDVWVLDNANRAGGGPSAWSPTTPMGTPPGPRSVFYHYQLYDPATRRQLFFGGDDDTGAPALTDYWVLTEADGIPTPTPTAWIQLGPTGGPPPPRRLHSTVYDPLSNRLIVFGGCTPVGTTPARPLAGSFGMTSGSSRMPTAWAVSHPGSSSCQQTDLRRHARITWPSTTRRTIA